MKLYYIALGLAFLSDACFAGRPSAGSSEGAGKGTAASPSSAPNTQNDTAQPDTTAAPANPQNPQNTATASTLPSNSSPMTLQDAGLTGAVVGAVGGASIGAAVTGMLIAGQNKVAEKALKNRHTQLIEVEDSAILQQKSQHETQVKSLEGAQKRSRNKLKKTARSYKLANQKLQAKKKQYTSLAAKYSETKIKLATLEETQLSEQFDRQAIESYVTGEGRRTLQGRVMLAVESALAATKNPPEEGAAHQHSEEELNKVLSDMKSGQMSLETVHAHAKTYLRDGYIASEQKHVEKAIEVINKTKQAHFPHLSTHLAP